MFMHGSQHSICFVKKDQNKQADKVLYVIILVERASSIESAKSHSMFIQYLCEYPQIIA